MNKDYAAKQISRKSKRPITSNYLMPLISLILPLWFQLLHKSGVRALLRELKLLNTLANFVEPLPEAKSCCYRKDQGAYITKDLQQNPVQEYFDFT